MVERFRYVSGWWVLPLRLFLGVMWLYHGIQKMNPSFGGIRGVVRVMAYGTSEHPGGNPIEPFRQFLIEFVLPNWQIFGALVMITETLVGIALILGIATRLAALVGIFLQVQYWIGRGYLEWPFVYPAVIAAHVILIWTAAGRVFGIDKWLARKWPRWPMW